MTQYKVGDTIIVNCLGFRIGVLGNDGPQALVLVALPSLRQCETIGCANPALDRMTQIAPATNIRVCGECAAKFKE